MSELQPEPSMVLFPPPDGNDIDKQGELKRKVSAPTDEDPHAVLWKSNWAVLYLSKLFFYESHESFLKCAPPEVYYLLLLT